MRLLPILTEEQCKEREDCSYCPYLNFDEQEQMAVMKQTGERPIHFCSKFDQQVYHYANFRDHSPQIFPCKECLEFK